MKLLGERNWWAPPALRRFHNRFGLHEAPSAPASQPTPVELPVVDTDDSHQGELVGR